MGSGCGCGCGVGAAAISLTGAAGTGVGSGRPGAGAALAWTGDVVPAVMEEATGFGRGAAETFAAGAGAAGDAVVACETGASSTAVPPDCCLDRAGAAEAAGCVRRSDGASITAAVMSDGAVMVAPHFGQGAETPAKWVGTRSFASQCEQVNLIFFTSFRLWMGFSTDRDSGARLSWVQTTERGEGLDKIEGSGPRPGGRG